MGPTTAPRRRPTIRDVAAAAGVSRGTVSRVINGGHWVSADALAAALPEADAAARVALRVLQEGEIVPVGDRRPRHVDVRVISATNRDLAAEVERGTFRSALFYRLSALTIDGPPLRTRREDVPLIAERVLTAASARHRRRIRGIDPGRSLVARGRLTKREGKVTLFNPEYELKAVGG